MVVVKGGNSNSRLATCVNCGKPQVLRITKTGKAILSALPNVKDVATRDLSR